MTTDQWTCPNGCDLRGDPIPESAFDPALHEVDRASHDRQVVEYGRCFCLPYGDLPVEERSFSRRWGVEIRGLYDGVAFFTCPDCGVRWHRFTTGTESDRRMRDLVEAWWARVDAGEAR